MDKLTVGGGDKGELQYINGKIVNNGETELQKMIKSNKENIEKFHNTIKTTENLTQVRIKSPDIKEPRKRLFGIF